MRSSAELPFCPLCQSPSIAFGLWKNGEYLRCSHCRSIFLHPKNHPDPEAERQRYRLHRNPGDTSGYLDFVRPLLTALDDQATNGNILLDYGCGPHAFLCKHLEEKGWKCSGYDPFFFPETVLKESHYDTITLVETMEHFHRPMEEFNRIKTLLKPGGLLLCMTSLWRDDMDFSTWYYKNDPTHVFFYHPQAMEQICTDCRFCSYRIEGNLVVFYS